MPEEQEIYDQEQIQANPLWALAFHLSEIDNDNAPIGWSSYIWKARSIMGTFDVTKKS